MDTRSASTGFKPLATTSHDNSTATPFSGVTGGKVFFLKVLTGTMRVNFEGQTTAPVYLPVTPADGPLELTMGADLLRKARVDTASAFTAVLVASGVL